MKKIKYLSFWIQTALWLLLAVFFIVCFWRYWAVSGVVKVTQDFAEESTPATNVVTPKAFVSNRLQDLQTRQRFIQVSGTPVSTQVTVPRQFDTVEATVRFANTSERLVEFGIVHLLSPLVTQLQPLEIALEQEAVQAGWSKVDSTAKGWTVYRRSESVDPVGSLSDLLPTTDRSRIAYYSGLKIPGELDMTTYEPARESQSFDVQLQGAHEFATVIQNEPLMMSFRFVDANTVTGADAGAVIVKNQSGEVVYEQQFADDDNISADRAPSEEKVIEVVKDGLPSGVYSITLAASPDILVTNITTLQRLLSATNRARFPDADLWRGAVATRPWSEPTFYTTSHAVQFETKEVSGTVVASVNDAPVLQAPPTKRALWKALTNDDQTTNAVQVRSERVTNVSGSSALAFTPDALFDPKGGMRVIDEHLVLDDIDVLIVPLQEPLTVSQYEKTRTVTLSLNEIIGDHKTPSFVVHVPGLLTSANHIDLQRIDYTFMREPLWERIQQRIK